jgi:hypothetical protein
VYAELLLRRFTRATRQWGLDETREGLITTDFKVPGEIRRGFAEAQLSLL